MLPMIAVSGTRSTMRRYNPLWDLASAPTQWWQNPTLSFGAGYPQWVPSSSVQVDPPPIQANPRATRGDVGVRQSECMKKCLSYGKWSKKRCKELCGETITRSAPRPQRGSCYKSGGGCKAGYRKVGYDKDGNAICCPGLVGPTVLNAAPRRGAGGGEACRLVCAHHGIGIEFHKCYQECMGIFRSRPGDGRRGRIRSSSRRRTQVRALARAARSMVSVGHAGAACCESCAQGGQCEGGCGANCTCGKEGPAANPTVSRGGVTYSRTPTMRMVPSARITGAPGTVRCWPKDKPCPKNHVKKWSYVRLCFYCKAIARNNPSTVLIGDMVFSPPTTSRLLR